MKQINLNELFSQSVCSFEAAKLAKQHGFTCANTYFAYDHKGVVEDAGWIEDFLLPGQTFFPCINIAMAISMVLSDTTINIDLALFFSQEYADMETVYICQYDGKLLDKNKNLCDLLISIWVKLKKPRS